MLLNIYLLVVVVVVVTIGVVAAAGVDSVHLHPQLQQPHILLLSALVAAVAYMPQATRLRD
jgi:hypothetical protein